MDFYVLLPSLAYLAVMFAAYVAVLVAALRDRHHTAAHLRRAAVLCGIVLILQLPPVIATIAFLQPGGGAGVRIGIAVGSLFGLALGTAYPLAQVPVAARLRAVGSPLPVLLSQPGRWRGWVSATVFGVLAGFASIWVMLQIGIDEGDAIRKLREMMPGVDTTSRSYLVLVALPAFLAAALTEEMAFRGIIQPWLARRFGGRSSGVFLAIAITSMVWALGHAANTSPMAPKLLQIFLLGLAFGWIARRHSVEASMAAHCGLNVAALGYAIVFEAG